MGENDFEQLNGEENQESEASETSDVEDFEQLSAAVESSNSDASNNDAGGFNTTASFNDVIFDSENIYQGNKHVNVYQYQLFGQKPTSQDYKNQAQYLPFPKRLRTINFQEQELLLERKSFCQTSRWIIIESNNDNLHYVSDAIAALVEEEEGIDYFEQQRHVRCEHYLRYGKKYACKSPSITRLPVDDLQEFKRFLETRENIQKLTETLENGKNRLLLIVNGADDRKSIEQIKALINQIGTDAHLAYWEPKATQSEVNQKVNFEQLDWLGKIMVTLCSWFAAIPYAVYHQIVLQLLEQKLSFLEYESEKGDEREEGKDKFKLWLDNWRVDPDIYLSTYGLQYYAEPNEGVAGVCFRENYLNESYRAVQLESSPFLLVAILPVIRDNLFSLDSSKLGDSGVTIFAELARFHVALNQKRLIRLDTNYLHDLFEQFRYAKTDSTTTIFRYVDFLYALYRQDNTSSLVLEFAEFLVNCVQQEERKLQTQKIFNVSVDKSISRYKAERMIYEAIKEQNSEQWFQFKDQIYATFNILAWSIGISEIKSIDYLERILSTSQSYSSEGGRQHPAIHLISYLFNGRLKQNPKDLLNMLNAMDKAQKQQDVYPETTLLMKTFTKRLIRRISDPANMNEDDLQYFYELLIETNGFQLVVELLKSSTETMQEDAEMLLKSIINLQHSLELIKEKIDSKEIEILLEVVDDTEQRVKTCLRTLAVALTKEDYRSVKESLKTWLAATRKEYRLSGKETLEHVFLREQKKMIAFVKQHFKRN